MKNNAAFLEDIEGKWKFQNIIDTDKISRLIVLAKIGVQCLTIKQIADSGTSLVSNQGQALDGYSELANYRTVIEKLKGEIK